MQFRQSKNKNRLLQARRHMVHPLPSRKLPPHRFRTIRAFDPEDSCEEAARRDAIQKNLILDANFLKRKAEIMKSSLVLFSIGVALLVISFGLDSYIFFNMWGETVGIIGDIQWISQILGIVFVGLGYWKKK